MSKLDNFIFLSLKVFCSDTIAFMSFTWRFWDSIPKNNLMPIHNGKSKSAFTNPNTTRHEIARAKVARNGKTLVYWTSQDDFGLLGFLVLTPKGVILAWATDWDRLQPSYSNFYTLESTAQVIASGKKLIKQTRRAAELGRRKKIFPPTISLGRLWSKIMISPVHLTGSEPMGLLAETCLLRKDMSALSAGDHRFCVPPSNTFQHFQHGLFDGKSSITPLHLRHLRNFVH